MQIKKASELVQHSFHRESTEGRNVVTSSTSGVWFGYLHKQRNMNMEGVLKETSTHGSFVWYWNQHSLTPSAKTATMFILFTFLTSTSSFSLCHR